MKLVSFRRVGIAGTATVLTFLLAPCRQATAQQAGTRSYTLAASEVHRLASGAVGDTFEISVALPLDYAQSDRRYPLVIALDADLAFAAVAQIARLMQFRDELPQFVLVGIGYGDLPTALRKRRRDLTPAVDRDNEACAEPGACGGAERFAGFIETELLPFLRRRYRVDASDLTLVGNSLGGLFGCYLLLERPRLFGRYLLGSPTVSWAGGWALAAVSPSAVPRDLSARVYVGVGGDEGEDVLAARTFVERLQGLDRERLSLTFQVFAGERHMSVQPMAVTRGLRVLFGTAPAGVPQPRF